LGTTTSNDIQVLEPVDKIPRQVVAPELEQEEAQNTVACTSDVED